LPDIFRAKGDDIELQAAQALAILKTTGFYPCRAMHLGEIVDPRASQRLIGPDQSILPG